MIKTIIKKGSYYDSVVLMLLTNRLSGLDGVHKVSVMMATPANKDMFKNNGLYSGEMEAAGPNDMAIAVEIDSEAVFDALLTEMDHFLNESSAEKKTDRKHSVTSWERALSALPDANLALISVPGIYAAAEAERALTEGLHVLLFSDNVSAADETRLKQLAHNKGLLLMGPDCGTAHLGGLPIAFANRIKPGGIGIAGASGTGTQELFSVISHLGGGISQAIGTGGRDLHQQVGAVTMLDAVDALAADEKTEVIIVISKPPADEIRQKTAAHLAGIDKPVVMLFLGEKPVECQEDLYQAYTIEEVAAAAVQLQQKLRPQYHFKSKLPPELSNRAENKTIKGIYCGGTLAYEAAMLIRDTAGIEARQEADGYLLKSGGHEVIDLGDDCYTRGKPHPMLDPERRISFMKAAADDPDTGVILFDVVLGYGAHPDMAGALTPCIRKISEYNLRIGRPLYFVAVLCGTDLDVQGYDRQKKILEDAGVIVFNSNKQAAVAALGLIGRQFTEPGKIIKEKRTNAMDPVTAAWEVKKLLKEMPSVINIGLQGFADNLREQGASVVQFDWKPPAGGDIRLIRVLNFLKNQDEINLKVTERIAEASVILTDVVPAFQVIPELSANRVLLHAGPPLSWTDMPDPMKGSCVGAVLFEGWAQDEAEAAGLLTSGAVTFIPCHHVNAVGPMGGITSAHMPVLAAKCHQGGNFAYCTMNEGIGKVLRFGAYSETVIERLKWMRDILGPVLGKALRSIPEGLALNPLIARALAMGDEFHQRNIAASALFLREIAPIISALDCPENEITQVLRFLADTDQFFLNIMMAASKAVMDYARTIQAGTVVTAMCRNGYEFGIRISGMGDEWFTAPVNTPEGLYFTGFSGEDASPDMGDSAITETYGVGGMAMIAAPAVTRFVGTGGFWDALEISDRMKEICIGQNPALPVPNWDFQGICLGIDARKVTATGITPVINTGIAHKKAGAGQIGAGTVRPPVGCFEKAVTAYARKLGWLE